MKSFSIPVNRIPFELRRIVSSGVISTVYLASRTDLQRGRSKNELDVAVKKIILATEAKERNCQLSLLVWQFGRIIKLKHPNILNYLDAYEMEQEDSHGFQLISFYVIMEYCHGGTVGEAVRKFGPIVSSSHIKRWAKDIILGLQFLHKQQIVHRNIHGGSIFLTTADKETCSLKIGGFQYSNFLNHGNSTSNQPSSLETINFVSPEIIKAYSEDGTVDQKTDIWSLGCVLIQILTGETPQFTKIFPDGRTATLAGPAPIMHFIFGGGSPDFPCGMSPEVEIFVKACLQHNPQNRSSSSELLKDIFITN